MGYSPEKKTIEDLFSQEEEEMELAPEIDEGILVVLENWELEANTPPFYMGADAAQVQLQ